MSPRRPGPDRSAGEIVHLVEVGIARALVTPGAIIDKRPVLLYLRAVEVYELTALVRLKWEDAGGRKV